MPDDETEIEMPPWVSSVESDDSRDMILLNIIPSPQSQDIIILPMSTLYAEHLIQALTLCVQAQKRRTAS